MKIFMINPVLRREIKSSMRSWKTFLSILIYLMIMTFSAFIFVYSTQFDIYSTGFNLQISMGFYILISALQLSFIVFICPALTSGSISGERERQTLDLMLLTKMSTMSIVIGKLLSSIGIVILMIITSFPVFAIILNYGGISILNVVGVFLFFILVACMMGSVGIFFSTIFKKTLSATVASYIFLMFICVFNVVIYGIYQIISYSYKVDDVASIFDTFKSIIALILGVGTNPFIGFMSAIGKQFNLENDIYYISRLIIGNSANNNDMSLKGLLTANMWIINIVINFMLTFIFLWLSSINLKPVKVKTKKTTKN